MARRNKVEKLKKSHLWPTFLSMFFVLLIMFVGVSIVATAIIGNLFSNKVIQGRQMVDFILDELAEEEVGSKEFEVTVEKLQKRNSDFISVEYKEGGKTIYSKGGALPEDCINIEYISDTEQIFVSKEGINDLVDIENSETDNVRMVLSNYFNSKAWNEMTNTVYTNQNEYLATSILKQSVWYSIPMENEQTVIVGYILNVGFGDLAYNLVALIGIAITGVLFCIVLLFSAIRMIYGQGKLIRLYYADKETGGRNWLFFQVWARKAIRRVKRKKYNYAMVHIRMEKFHNYKTCYGEAEGKDLIFDFYQVLRKNIKKNEMVSRVEMADFALLLAYNDEDELIEKVKSLMGQMDALRPNVKQYFSAGIFLITDAKLLPSEAYNRASTARSSLSDDHTSNIAFFSEKMREELMWQRKVENDMEHALLNHEFVVYLQPKYSTSEEKLAAAEALVRWIHPTEGFVPPYRFIPIFEDNGFILKLDDYMIREVAKLQAGWLAEGKEIVPISVNVSRAHFTKEDLAEHICEIIDEYKVPHEYIELELTESAFFDDKQTLINIVNHMKDLGFAVSMDDFGAGYSSLNSLKELPIDVVKLDAEFFRGDDQDGKGKVIVKEAISLAKKLDMKIVAEGIETREQVDFLADEHCDLIQGYYFAKPMPVSEFEEQAFGVKNEETVEA